VIADGETGRLVPQRDPAALARAVKELAADRDKAVAMGLAGREKGLSMCDPRENTRTLMRLFQDGPDDPSVRVPGEPADRPEKA
jgi:glycosyltransferase involved in cell wall biosynthesis